MTPLQVTSRSILQSRLQDPRWTAGVLDSTCKSATCHAHIFPEGSTPTLLLPCDCLSRTSGDPNVPREVCVWGGVWGRAGTMRNKGTEREGGHPQGTHHPCRPGEGLAGLGVGGSRQQGTPCAVLRGQGRGSDTAQ